MMDQQTQPTPHAAPKWAVLVNDTVVAMPRQRVVATVIRYQAGIPINHALVRDHNSPEDPFINDDATVDLAHGNVFYSVPACEVKPRPHCASEPKRAYFVDDRWELAGPVVQTGRSIRELFGLANDVELLRDLESPNDTPVGINDLAPFGAGPVFRTRKGSATLKVFVNNQPFTEADGVRWEMTGKQIAALVGMTPDDADIFRVEGSGQVPIAGGDTVKIENCQHFRVIKKCVIAGFESSRVERELARLREGGARVTLVADPAAVILHDLPALDGTLVDVLVSVPPGYPGGMLDNAFLPKGSPLLNTLLGAAQHTITADGREWVQKSLHPHNAPGNQWDKNRHGFHTYYGEILAWVSKRQ